MRATNGSRAPELYLRRPTAESAFARVVAQQKRPKKQQHLITTSKDPEGPPRMPRRLDELAEALTLVGHYLKAPLRRQAPRQRLAALLGAVPSDADVAARWKAKVRQQIAQQRDQGDA